MSDKKEIFADGIGQIHFTGGMVRFDFMTLQPDEEGKKPAPQSNIRIIMPPQGFLTAFNSMQQLIDKLVEAKVLKKNQKPQKLVKKRRPPNQQLTEQTRKTIFGTAYKGPTHEKVFDESFGGFHRHRPLWMQVV